MTAHCSTCTCQSDPIPQPATSSTWAREQAKRAAKEATAAAVKATKERRLAAAKEGKA